MPDSPREFLQMIRAGFGLEEQWRTEVGRILDLYSGRGKTGGRGHVSTGYMHSDIDYNILYANTQVLRAAIYSNAPRPDVRRRFRDKDPIARIVSEALERVLSYSIDTMDWAGMIEYMRDDYLLAGRSIVRVRYEPKFKAADTDEPELVYQTVTAEAWPYEDFARSAHTRWPQVEWIAFRHWMPKKEAEKEFETEFPIGHKSGSHGHSVPKDAAAMASKSIEVWECWYRPTRMVLWISEEDQTKFLREMDDPLRLTGFFPVPRPLYSVSQCDTLIPVPEYVIYRDLADELQTLTDRMNRIERSIRVRGIYDGSISEIGRLFEAPDTDMIPSDNVAKLRQTGGIEGAVWMYDNSNAAETLGMLSQYRDKLLQAIYEITGISDIIRGASRASETATAQNLKARYGSLRIEPRQNNVAEFLRDLLRLWAEIVCEHFTPETLVAMTGMTLPDPAIWEAVVQAMRNEVQISYRIDIETDSTIADLTMVDQAMLNELLGAVGTFTQAMTPLVESGAVPEDVAKTLMMAVIRRAKLGSQVEDAIEAVGEAETPKIPPEIQAQMQEGMQRLELQQQQIQELEGKLGEAMAVAEDKTMERQIAQMEIQIKAAESAAKVENLAADTVRKATETSRLQGDDKTAQAVIALQQQLGEAQAALAEKQGDLEIRSRESAAKIDNLAADTIKKAAEAAKIQQEMCGVSPEAGAAFAEQLRVSAEIRSRESAAKIDNLAADTIKKAAEAARIQQSALPEPIAALVERSVVTALDPAIEGLRISVESMNKPKQVSVTRDRAGKIVSAYVTPRLDGD